MSIRAKIENWLHQEWARFGLLSAVLSPLSLIFYGIARTRKRRTVEHRLLVPVVVVGNIYVGGTGKTPVTITIVKELQRRGWKPGIISRGFGRSAEEVSLVTAESTAAQVGDEPLLISRETGVPVAVGRQRYQAGLALRKAHPEIDVIVSDDGLQHHALARDFEIAVVGTRGLGNGLVLPAGPLREPPSRLDTVDAIVLNTNNEVIVKSRTPRYAASSCFGQCTQLATGKTATIDELAERIHEHNWKPLSAAGIAAPQRFFAMIRAHDVEGETIELGDHFDFAENPFAGRTEDIIFITGKDAVKCYSDPVLSKDERLWVVSLDMHLDPSLIDSIETILNNFSRTVSVADHHNHPQAAV